MYPLPCRSYAQDQLWIPSLQANDKGFWNETSVFKFGFGFIELPSLVLFIVEKGKTLRARF